MARIISANLVLAKKKYVKSRRGLDRKRVGVCCWELAHNPAGRAYTLATLYQTFADVEIIGSFFPKFGKEIWEPIRGTSISKHGFVVSDESRFVEQAIELVAAHPYDIVHLSKPRAPNILFGILYKLLWGAKVIVDIDDEELAIVDADSPISISEFLQKNQRLPDLHDLPGKSWTRIAVGMADAFDGITVSNPALRRRYGGEIIRHARDEKAFVPSTGLKERNRARYDLPRDDKIVLFFGTPRAHKGLIEVAETIAALERSDVLFVVVGDFSDMELKKKLQQVRGCRTVFLPNQPFRDAPQVVSIADVCVLLQDGGAVSNFQVPAKLSDALGMRVPVLANFSPAIEDLIACGAVEEASSSALKQQLEALLSSTVQDEQKAAKRNSAFLDLLSVKACAQNLKDWLDKLPTGHRELETRIYDSFVFSAVTSKANYVGATRAVGQTEHALLEEYRSGQRFKPLFRLGADAFMLRGLRPTAPIAVVVNAINEESWEKALRLLVQLGQRHDLFILGSVDVEHTRFHESTVSVTNVGAADSEGNAQNFLRVASSHVFDEYQAVLWLTPGLAHGKTLQTTIGFAAAFLEDPAWGICASTVDPLTDDGAQPGLTNGVKVALSRLGVNWPSAGVQLPIGGEVWIKPLLMRALASTLWANELTGKSNSNGFPGRPTVLGLMSAMAELGGFSVRNKPIEPPLEPADARRRVVKTIAFYLPQFHPIPENDLWWGKGFTEWSNVTRARQLFRGHYQPRVPSELGYYDLRLEDTQIAQAHLASEFGIHGFCYYYYWFDGKKLLNQPIEQMARSTKIDTGFCVCWANENWSRNWDGQNRHILMEQTYTLESNIALIRELIPMMKDPRWIRHAGKPVMMVYRISIIPNWLETAAAWREECRRAGVGEIHLCAVRFGLETLQGSPQEHALDSYVLFPPHEAERVDLRDKVHDLNKNFGGQIFDYTSVIDADLERFKDGYESRIHRGAMLGWDNTARRLTDARVFHGATPYGFRRWMNGILEQEQRFNDGDESLVFVNAWNEWAEGTYLEPDQRWGRAYLKAFASAVGSTPGVTAAILPEGVASQPRVLTAVAQPEVLFDDKIVSASVDWHSGEKESNPAWPTIMICAHVSGHQLFGGERSLLDVLSALTEMNVNVVTTLPSGRNAAYIREVCARSLGVYAFPYTQWKNNRGVDTWLVATFSDIIARHAVDVVHANTIVLMEPLEAAARMRRVRVVHARELISLDDNLRQQIGLDVGEIISRVFERSDWVIGNSVATCQLFSRPEKTLYVPNAVTIEDFDLGNKFGNTIKFGIVSSNLPKKGVTDFVEVARRVADRAPRARFVIVGPVTKQVTQWQEEVASGRRPNNLIIAGYAEHPRKAMSELNVLLNLSHFAESFGRTVAEGMAARRPIIAYDWGALTELIQHGETGFLVPYRNVEAVADAVVQICEDDTLISRMGEAGREYVSRKFTQDTLRSGLSDAYGKILHGSNLLPSENAPAPTAAQVIGYAPRTSIIVPVYNAASAVRDCLESVLKHTDLKRDRLIVIDDGSTDPSIAPLLAEFKDILGVTIQKNDSNLGYTKTINRGIRLAENDDVVLLNSDTVVTPRWLEGLRAAAYARAKVATVTAMSDNAGAFSFPTFNEYCPRPSYLSHEEYALRVTRETWNCNAPEVPTGSGFCMYIRRLMMEECGLFDEEGFPRGYGEENDFCMRAVKAGWRNVISPWSFVYHIRTASFKGEKAALVSAGVDVVTRRYPDYSGLVKAAFAGADMKCLREAAARALND
ncbi:glycoside hydrolase family 99-like domain-containing protein [Paraburkholderia sp. ZP32-5]|uniref:glycoside hydrolase family 99-like domain-containing protein n=1 Tax=Paraburkholderia sp. ZP32-5 TaxID=2883245 RepID=UPI001F203899|nr:glycoside hydrolase family 99-like domain-containing protein [Paraburkholderia sp. ZP32-5]